MSRRDAPAGRGTQRRTEPAPKHSAATSHLQNDRFMSDWEKAYKELEGMALSSGGPPSLEAPRRGQGPGALPAALSSSVVSTSKAASPGPTSYRSASARGVPGSLADTNPAAVTRGWHTGPTNQEGTLCDVSDRPNTCCAANWAKGEAVVGSTDHALYIIDTVKGTRKRTLYSKTCGHSEWVTCCTYLPTGQVVSGGMDSKLWLWPAGGVRGVEAHGHGGPISQVVFDSSSGLVVSASYDKTVKLWDCAGLSMTEAGCMAGHTAPVLELDVSPDGLVLTGDRSGCCIVWDASVCEEVWRLKNIHQGHVTALAWFDYNDSHMAGCFATGGQDGVLRAWDPRERSCLAKQELHVNQQGRGALGDLAAGGPAAGEMVVSSGADGTVCITDPRMSFSLVHQIQLSNFPYSMAVAGGLALVGCGDGSLWVIHISTGKVLYCLGANKHAVRCIAACEDKLLASGDDGKVILWSFD